MTLPRTRLLFHATVAERFPQFSPLDDGSTLVEQHLLIFSGLAAGLLWSSFTGARQ